PYLSFGLIAIIPVTLPLFVIIAYFITYPIEKLISISYLKKARKKLAEQKNILVIGVTGSFGKTSVKNILSTILEEKFKVCSTPASYNTPLGLSKTILKKLTNDDEILIAEMGAKQTGDIKELCEMVNPTIGVITGIGNQHLLTFGSLDNISKTKGELADYVSKSNGKIYFNVDTEAALNLSNKYKDAVKTAISTSEYDLKVESLKVDKDGSSFKLVYDKKKVECSTVLLGNHNVSNIVLAARIALDLGLSLEEISSGISKLKAIPHRLEILKSSAEYTIIDDAYNCSVEGSKASLEVLSRFEGKKIVITPGLVELGADQFNSNFEFGRDLAKVCDYVIIDSTINYDAISSGLIFAGFDENKIIQVVSLSKAVEMLKDIATKGDVVLFENDLPDNYS
ncbi:MAG: UDP-N-acetylmuramoyl-tripeptide--D-alanyl-D-alanine ligase, partial [Clostridia bacterium]|nr:UDP-N-acetylmuramoyl-tripeptide--D-alanyl-D-alanine ligase [Clostridia bacterium]